MARTQVEINAELDRMNKLASRMREIASGLKTIASGEYQTGVDMIRTNWTGETAEQFLGKTDTVRSELDETVKQLNETAATLQTIAQNYARAELAALAIISK